MKRLPKSSLVVGGVLLAIMAVLFITSSPEGGSAKSLHSLPKRSSTPPALNLAKKLIPPTNRWFSSLVFSPDPQPIYAYPLAYQSSGTGFGTAYPKVISEPDIVKAPFIAEINYDFGQKLAHTVIDYDDLSVQIEHANAGRRVASSRLTQGSPFLFTHITQGTPFTLGSNATMVTKQKDGSFVLKSSDNQYLVSFAPEDFISNIDGSHLKLTALKDQALISTAIMSDPSQLSAFQAAALNEITATTVDSSASGSSVTTQFKLTTKNSQPTLFALLPLQDKSNTTNNQSFGSYTTLYGNQNLHSGNQYDYKLNGLPSQQLQLSGLSTEQRQKLTELVASDASTLKFTKTDSYYASKELYRASMLLQLAHQLNMTAAEQKLKTALRTELSVWLDPSLKNSPNRYFYYDKDIKGLVGVESGFGSELFNDHHFHYGYFISAAATLGSLDKSFVAKYGPMVDLIVKDIANNDAADKNFPKLRVFDRYTGHSFASGFSIFADGNNQESSSEAVNAWAGVYNWASVIGNLANQQTAQYLYANESNAALSYWLNIDKNQSIYQNYTHSWVDIVWGAKLDYATFFDASPESKLAIQLLPLSPSASYVGSDPARVTANLAALKSELNGRPIQKFADYLLMYQAISDPSSALQQLPSIVTSQLDDANSMSYLYAWVYSHQSKP